MKSTLVIVSLVSFLAYVQPFALNVPFLSTSESFITACAPCENILKECEVAVKSQVVKCIESIQDSACRENCGRIIVNLPNSQAEEEDENVFYCDYKYGVQNLACKLSCRSLDEFPYHRDGSCDAISGRCTCSKRN